MNTKQALPNVNISQESFRRLVKSVAARRGKIVAVAVTGFGFVLTLQGKRLRYNVHGAYHPATNSWTGHDSYLGGATLRGVMREIGQAIKENQ